MKKILFMLVIALSSAAMAGDLLQWQDTNASILRGQNFKVDPSEQTTLSLEHASGWSFGDFYMFFDTMYFTDNEKNAAGNQTTYYGEIAPRLSFGKMLQKDLSFGIIKDVLVASNFEFGQDADESLMLGLGIDLNIPGFDYFQLNMYRRMADMSADLDQYQITPCWRMTFPVKSTSIVFDGYIDYIIGDGTDHFHFNPQVKLDVGVLAGMDAAKLYAGVEYDYWKSKYGLDTDQNTFSFMVQYHF